MIQIKKKKKDNTEEISKKVKEATDQNAGAADFDITPERKDANWENHKHTYLKRKK